MGGKLSQRNGQRLAGGKPIPKSQFALPGQRYPVDTVKRARNALSRVAQFGTPEEKSRVRSAVKRKYSQIKVGGMQNHSNSYDLANVTCPRCGYEIKDSDGDYDQDNSREGSLGGPGLSKSPGALRTPDAAPRGSGTVPLKVRGASSGNMGLANGSGRSIELSRRQPVRQPGDMIVSSAPGGGPAVIRHRIGGNTIGQISQGSNGWQGSFEGRALSPHSDSRAALAELIGVYNKAAAMPLSQPPQTTERMQQFGVPAIRLASDASSASDGPRSTGSDTDDDGDSDGNGLTPRGKQIFAKLKGKGISPKVALAMAKRSQNGPPGRRS